MNKLLIMRTQFVIPLQNRSGIHLLMKMLIPLVFSLVNQLILISRIIGVGLFVKFRLGELC